MVYSNLDIFPGTTTLSRSMTKNPEDRKRYRNACKKVSILKQQEPEDTIYVADWKIFLFKLILNILLKIGLLLYQMYLPLAL